MAAAHWFDSLGRSMARRADRRHMLRMAAALTASLAVGGLRDTAAADICDEHFESKKDQDFCRTKRKRCKKAGTKFCIQPGDLDHPDEHATCCFKGQSCCPGAGCISEKQTCCPNTADGYCLRGDSCCPGIGCVDTSSDADHCGGCDNRCRADRVCVDGRCVCGRGMKLCTFFGGEREDCYPEEWGCCEDHLCPGPPNSVGTECCGPVCSVKGTCWL